MNIYQRIDKVRQALGYIKKDKEVSTGGSGSYLAVTHDQVTAMLRPHLVEWGIVVTPSLVASKMVDTGTTTAKGVPFMRYEATFDVSFVNMDSPDDRHTVRLESHAIDQGDKAPGKAISYVQKYAMLKVFNLETGEDDESRVPAYAVKESSKGQTRVDWESLEKRDPDLAQDLMASAAEVIEAITANNMAEAVKIYNEKKADLDPEDQSAFWFLFSSKQRSAIKAFGKAKQ